MFKRILRNKTLINGSLFSIFSFINRGFSFLLMMVLAAYITPSEYGHLSLFGTVILLVSVFIALSADSYLSITYFAEGKDGVKKYFSSISITIAINCIIFFVSLLLMGKPISEKVDLPLVSLYLSIPICAFTVFANANLELCRVQENIKKYGLFSILNALSNFLITILLIAFFATGWIGRVYAQMVCSMIFGIIGICVFFKYGLVGRVDVSYWKRMLIWSIPLIPHVASTFLKQGCDRFIINSNWGIEDVGLFSFAMNMANIMTMLGTGFNQSNSVDIFQVLGNKNLTSQEKLCHLQKQKKSIALIYVVSAIVILVGIYFLTPIILPQYAESINFMPLLIVSSFFGCISLLYSNFLYYYNRTKNIMLITISCSVIHLILSFFLTRYSLYATCLIYCFSQLLTALLIRHFAKVEISRNL